MVNDLNPLGNELWLCNIDYYEDAPIGIYGCDNLEHSGNDQQGQLTVAGYHNSDHILFNTPAESSSGQQYRPHTAHDFFNDHNRSLLLSPSTHPDLSSLNPIVFSNSRASWSPETRPGPSIPSNFLPSPSPIDKPTEIPGSITSAFVYCQRCPRKFPSKHELETHLTSNHQRPTCRCSCARCSGQPDSEFLGPFCNGPYQCACGKPSGSNKARFKEHIRPRRQFQCSCGKVFREEKFKDHLSRCDGGSEPFVCWRPNNDHRHEFSTREDIMAHYTSCPRRKRGRPRKARTEG